jgi:hypothetical protein
MTGKEITPENSRGSVMKLIEVKPSGMEATVCAIDEVIQNSYATLCGWQLWNRDELVFGAEFIGKYTEITCPKCKQILAYFQQIFKTE